MKTSLIPALNLSMFAVPYFATGMALALQTRRVPFLTTVQEQLGAKIQAGFLGGLLSLVLVIVIFRFSIRLITKVHKKKSFHRKLKKSSLMIMPLLWICRVLVPLLSMVSAVLLLHFESFDAFARDLAQGLYVWVSALPMGYAKLFDSSMGMICHVVITCTSFVLLLWGGMKVYVWLRSSKHAPICKTYNIHGKLNSLIGLLWTSAKVKGFGLGIKSEDVVGVPEDTVFTETITSNDWRESDQSHYTMAFRENYMPHPAKVTLTEGHVKSVMAHLGAGVMAGQTLHRENLLATVRSTALFEAQHKGEIYQCPDGLTKENLSALIMTLMSKKQEDLLQLDAKALLKSINKGSRLYDFGGLFICQLFKEIKGNLTPTTKLRENLQKTLDLTTSNDGYGEDYLTQGNLLVALTYNHFGQSDDVSDEAVAEAGENFGSERNTIVEYKKTWYNKFWDGLGRSYMFYHNGSKYIYDEWWFGSIKWFNPPFAKAPKERACRRVGYVRQAGGEVVAKIEDQQILLKLLGSYNRQVSIYDETLASDEKFGTLLCLFSQYLTHQQEYRCLRLQDSLPQSVGYNGGDMDATQA